MKKLTASSYSLLVLMAIALAMVVRSAFFPFFETKALPMLLGSVVFVVLAAEFARELRAKREPEKAREPAEATERTKKRMGRLYLEFGAWLAGFLVAVYLFGFLIAIPVFVISYFKTHGGGWVSGIILTAVTTGFVWVAFDFFLKVSLTEGLLIRW